MKYELVIGLETHVELSTDSKLFCSCGGHSSPKEPNDCVCPACSGMPGMLPVTNKHAIELAVKAGFMLNCKINQYTTFDKKSYYYPDLPCAYQITQWFNPICVEGTVDVDGRKIGIKQIHLEEDAGKLIHDEATNTSFVDFNRTSVPLIEIVSKPDFRSSEEVISYLKKLKSALQFAGISECEEGAMRCDVNISVRPEGSKEFGVRSEIKNMSSLSEIKDAIEFEKVRHVDAIERHTEILVQETRRWDDVKRRTFPMRNKETAADYRYFPDPNLMPIVIDDAWLEEIRKSMPATADEKAKYYEDMGIAAKEAAVLASDRKLCEVFDTVVASGRNAKTVASWILTECMGIMKRLEIATLDICPDKLSRIIELVEKNEITRAAGKKVLSAVFEKNVDVDAFCEEQGLNQKVDDAFILETVRKAIAENEKIVADYKGGKVKALQALFGLVMRELKGNGDPAVIRSLLETEVNK
ncbi:MAG: Asp-tRNA(Asn)/Glu-tRNA(Gln) amidotransferase subunit GatB [Clostridia bacterium]|nr:Asp-tRNA(Asn)/Glu-tRNA(Gln) amidotransferase subunit GatB [Oscillospiraceae bacterium]MBQ7005942.1 Asp-tRNA(Asn)/Glu-tRNA(Gln) amidotransferase subunit GatB [Clostridia bacterium]